MGNLFAALPQAAVKYSYMHSDTDAFADCMKKSTDSRKAPWTA